MKTLEETPEDNRDLAKVEVDFPYPASNSADSCPVPVSEIMEYLSSEVPDGEKLSPSDLHFIRTAQVAERQYWIWWFKEPDGAGAYVAVSAAPNRARRVTYDENHYQLSPEQFMLGDYHNVF